MRAAIVLGAVLCTGTLAFAGCGAPTDASSPSTAGSTLAPPATSASPLPSPTPSADPLTVAVSTTSALGTAELTVEAFVTVDGVDYVLEGHGPALLANGDADLSWSSDAGASREITSDGIGYVQLDPPDGEWITLPEDESVPTLAAGQPLRNLTELAEVRVDGEEQLDDIATTRYVGWLPAADHLDGFGLNDLDARGVTDDRNARINVTVWVDGLGRIVRVTRTLDSASGIAASTTTSLRDLGGPLEVIAPIESAMADDA